MPNGMVNVQDVLNQLEEEMEEDVLELCKSRLRSEHAGELPTELPFSEIWRAIDRCEREKNGPPSAEVVEESNRILSIKFTSYP